MSDDTIPAVQPAKRPRGLGSGLSSLFQDGPSGFSPRSPQGPVAEIDIDLIDRNPNQPRRTFDEAELLSLVDSIQRHGILQPILLRTSVDQPGRYQLIAGERRWRAAQAAGLRAVPAAVRSFDDLAMLEAAVVENLQRIDLNPVDEALAYKQLIDRFGKTQAQVAEQVGRSRVHIANTVRLLALPDEVRQHLLDGRLTAGHARTLLSADDPVALAREAVEKGLSVRDLERRVARDAAGVPQSKAQKPARNRDAPKEDADTAALEADLSASLGLPVVILQQGHQSGHLQISYDTLEQLDDLCRRLSWTNRMSGQN
jgi:ParB family transcriptional regulator, chromosome partitioning protein